MNSKFPLFIFYWSLGAEIGLLFTNIACWDQNSFQARAFLSSCTFFTKIQNTELTCDAFLLFKSDFSRREYILMYVKIQKAV